MARPQQATGRTPFPCVPNFALGCVDRGQQLIHRCCGRRWVISCFLLVYYVRDVVKQEASIMLNTQEGWMGGDRRKHEQMYVWLLACCCLFHFFC
ncbi:hypothetical protein BRADI_5g00489v3 [Brachypodium distachyon]|uniref:Uncharacterized protein n=1 Tax=Brachypodium distachyon TaxID=15368 RepID=A0A0Q3NY55_BRADI|nr:hypothetical protein BRADI_5g00489v3 [Brachypodium distachyon]